MVDGSLIEVRSVDEAAEREVTAECADEVRVKLTLSVVDELHELVRTQLEVLSYGTLIEYWRRTLTRACCWRQSR